MNLFTVKKGMNISSHSRCDADTDIDTVKDP